LNDAGIPTFRYPDTAARVFNYMAQYSYNLRGLYETPVLADVEEGIPDRDAAAALVDAARAEGRTLLTEYESKRLLELYGLPTIETHIASDADEAVQKAEAIGYPVVLKLHSTIITH